MLVPFVPSIRGPLYINIYIYIIKSNCINHHPTPWTNPATRNFEFEMPAQVGPQRLRDFALLEDGVELRHRLPNFNGKIQITNGRVWTWGDLEIILRNGKWKWDFVSGNLLPRVLKSDRDPSRRSPPRGRCRCTFSLQVGLGDLEPCCNSRRTSQRL